MHLSSPAIDTRSIFLDNGRKYFILDNRMSEDSLTPSVRRTIEVLEALLAHPQGLTLQQLLAAVDGSRSSVFLMLSTLKSLGYVEQSERRGRYRAGARLLAWRVAAPATFNADLLKAFYAEAEAAQLQETLALATPLPGGEVQVIGQVEGRAGVRSVFADGQRLSAQSAAGALFCTVIAEAIRTQQYSLAQRGDAIDVACPVCRDGVAPVAALLMSAPVHRWATDDGQPLLALLSAMAARLSYRLGATGYAPWRTDAQAEMAHMAEMDAAAIDAMLAAPWMARLACVGRNGAPHVIPVWHEWDRTQRVFHILAWRGSRWAEYLRGNPQVSITVDEPWPPLRRVSARGVATPLYDGGDLRLKHLLARLSRRYLGRNAVDTLAPQVEGSFVIAPQSLRGWQGLLTGDGARVEKLSLSGQDSSDEAQP